MSEWRTHVQRAARLTLEQHVVTAQVNLRRLTRRVQLLQVPFVQIAVFSLNLGVALNLTVSAYWAPRDGDAGMVLGINFLALAVLVVLWLCRPKVAVAQTGGIDELVGPERRPRASQDE